MTTAARAPGGARRLQRHLRLHARLWTALLLGVVAGGAWSPPELHGLVGHLLVGWNAGVLAYLLQIGHLASRATQASMRARARLEDEGPPVILALVLTSVLASLAAIVLALGHARHLSGTGQAVAVALAGATVFSSWLLLQVTFALHYAHEFYAPAHPGGQGSAGPMPAEQAPAPVPGSAHRGGLAFPGEPAPDYWDFIYLAAIIGTSAQTADVSFTSRTLRRLGLLHSVLAFFFNTMVLALLINITASLL